MFTRRLREMDRRKRICLAPPSRPRRNRPWCAAPSICPPTRRPRFKMPSTRRSQRNPDPIRNFAGRNLRDRIDGEWTETCVEHCRLSAAGLSIGPLTFQLLDENRSATLPRELNLQQPRQSTEPTASRARSQTGRRDLPTRTNAQRRSEMTASPNLLQTASIRRSRPARGPRSLHAATDAP